MSPLQENTAIHRHAKAAGLEYVRDYRCIHVTDMKALKAAGFTVCKEVADRGRIAEALDAGVEVPGAEMNGREFVLRRRE